LVAPRLIVAAQFEIHCDALPVPFLASVETYIIARLASHKFAWLNNHHCKRGERIRL
jgi:hypothetical protein